MGNQTRNYRDNVFCLLHRDRKNLLSVYNAMNGTDYQNEEELTVVTLDLAFCVRMKNDAAFVIDGRLSLYEQQSTVNPNMPLRDLYYVAEELKRIVPMSELYRKAPVRIPAPKFLVFYNGEAEQPAEVELRLSDLYERDAKDPELELVVRQININKGYNEELLKKCESLRGYMIFVNKVREKKAAGMELRDAVTAAVDECVRENVLAGFFREHRSEVIEMGIYEFDEEAYERVIREESEQEGIKKGREEGRAEGREEGRAEGRVEGRAEGRVEGKAEGKAEDILELLEDLGEVPEELRQKVMGQKDLDVLKKWHKLAARVKSVGEFTEGLLPGNITG